MRTGAPGSPRNRGFSLIEVTLALLVFAMAVMAVLSLFPSGAVTNRDAQDYTYSAQFARRVFDGVLTETMGSLTNWNRLWNSATSGCANTLTISTAPASQDFLWTDPTSFSCVLSTNAQTVVFRSVDDTNVMDHVLRYRLVAEIIEVPRNLNTIATWVTDSNELTNANGTVLTNLYTATYWWIQPTLYNNYEHRYREQTVRLILDVWPGYYGTRNAQRYFCYVPRFM